MSPARPKPYTEPAHHLLTLAARLSLELHAGYTGTEHLLLALLLFPDSGACRVLGLAQIEAEAIRRRLRNLMVVHEAGDQGIPSSRPTEAVNRVLSDAIDEAERLGFPYVASEQILVALTHQADTIAARVLADLGLDATRARALVNRLHKEAGGGLPPAPVTREGRS